MRLIKSLTRFNAYTKTIIYIYQAPRLEPTEGEFTEDQIYNWTYSDEQEAKANWVGKIILIEHCQNVHG